jgi:hypothetical protein
MVEIQYKKIVFLVKALFSLLIYSLFILIKACIFLSKKHSFSNKTIFKKKKELKFVYFYVTI